MEVLVHLSASSSRADDDRYTLQARNYLTYIAGLQRENVPIVNESDEAQTKIAVDCKAQEKDEDIVTQRQALNDSTYNEGDNIGGDSSGYSDPASHESVLHTRAPSFPFPDSGVSNQTPSVANETLRSFASVSSIFTAASSFINSQNQNRKRPFSEFASFTGSQRAEPLSQRPRLSTHSGLTAITPSVSALGDDLCGDTTDIALAIAEVEERRAVEQMKDANQYQRTASHGQAHETLQDVQSTSQRTESLLGSSPCDGRETERETTVFEEKSTEKGMLLVTPKLLKYLPPPISPETSARKGSNLCDPSARDKRSPDSERFYSASSTVSHHCISANKSPKVLSGNTKATPIKSTSQRHSLLSSQNPAPHQPLSTLPFMHTPIRAPKHSSLKASTNVTSALQYLISNPLLIKHYNCCSPSNSHKHTTRKTTSASTTKRQTRPLRTFERGYWHLDPSPWPPALQSEFWIYLGRVIRAGRAGWGVWCVRQCHSRQHRDDNDDEKSFHSTFSMSSAATINERNGKSMPCSDSVPATATAITADGPQFSSLGPLKIFCWGETVPHIYLLLYVASRRALRNIEARWIDVKGEVVVRIGPGLDPEGVQT